MDIDSLKRFMENIDSDLENYLPGRPEKKPDVLKQMIYNGSAPSGPAVFLMFFEFFQCLSPLIF